MNITDELSKAATQDTLWACGIHGTPLENPGDQCSDYTQDELEYRYNDYTTLCQNGDVTPMSFEEWKALDQQPQPQEDHPGNTREELEQMIEDLRQENEELIAELEATKNNLESERQGGKQCQRDFESLAHSKTDGPYEQLAERLYVKLFILGNSSRPKAWDKWDTQLRIEVVETEINNLVNDLKWYDEEWKKIPERKTPVNQPLFPHYFVEVPLDVTHVDIYWVLKQWQVTDPCVQHAVKKLFAAGRRGAKDTQKDLMEARDSITRALELM